MFKTTGSTFKSLIDKTPMKSIIKGKKRFLNHSFNEQSVNLFSTDYSDVVPAKPIRKVYYERSKSNEVRGINEIGEREYNGKKNKKNGLYWKFKFY